jgi:hypothetical protein
MWTHVLEESIASIFRDENQRAAGRPKMEMIILFETSVHMGTIRCYIPEDGNIRNYLCENNKSYTAFYYVFISVVDGRWY